MPAKPASKSGCCSSWLSAAGSSRSAGGWPRSTRPGPARNVARGLGRRRCRRGHAVIAPLRRRGARRSLLVLFGRAEHGAVDGGPPVVQVDVVLPGHADAAGDLHAVVDDVAGSARRRTPWPRCARRAASSVPSSTAVASGVAAPPWSPRATPACRRSRCLSAWNDDDRPTEGEAVPPVLEGELERPVGDADHLGALQGERELELALDVGGRAADRRPRRRRRGSAHAVEVDRCRTAGSGRCCARA